MVVLKHFFQFYNKYYRKIFGISIGLSVSSQFADIVMMDLEEKCLKICRLSRFSFIGMLTIFLPVFLSTKLRRC